MPSESEDPARQLTGGVTPPAALKRRVIETLRARGLVRMPPARSWGPARILAYAAVAVLLFTGGALVARWTRPASDPAGTRFALFLYEDRAFQPTVPDSQLVAEYVAWADSLGQQGKLVMGEELDPHGAAVLAGSGDAVTVSPGAVESVAGALTGFFIVRASTPEEARAIAHSCPHLKYGGRIALRRLRDAA